MLNFHNKSMITAQHNIAKPSHHPLNTHQTPLPLIIPPLYPSVGNIISALSSTAHENIKKFFYIHINVM